MSGSLAILGYGRFGRALADLALDAGLAVRAWDPVAEVPGPLRVASLDELCRGADVVVPATPVRALRDALLGLRPSLSPKQLVIDVSSVKLLPLRDLTEVLGEEIPWALTHPLFGPSSVALGERPLTVVVCPGAPRPDAPQRAARFWERLGCVVVEQDADAHDRVMAATHALAFFVSKGLLDVGAGENVPFAPPSFQAIARTIEAVRSDASHLFRTIQSDNVYAAEARARLLDALSDIHRQLAAEPEAEAAARLAIPDLGARAPALREIRDLIDDTDRELLSLLARREQLARRAGRVKAAGGLPILDAERERALLAERREWAAHEGLEPDTVEDLFRQVLRVSRAAQRESG
jgi:prephenate dehydrogenase